MKHSFRFVADVGPEGEVYHPELAKFDSIRDLLIANGLPPTPPVYELLWRYVTDDSHDLSRAVDFAIATRALDLRMAMTLHGVHCVKWHDD